MASIYHNEALPFCHFFSIAINKTNKGFFGFSCYLEKPKTLTKIPMGIYEVMNPKVLVDNLNKILYCIELYYEHQIFKLISGLKGGVGTMQFAFV
jgi:hypothetical protein